MADDEQVQDTSLWGTLKADYFAFDAWSARVIKGIGNTIEHPIDTAASVVKPLGDWASGTLWQIGLILALAIGVYVIFKKEVNNL